MNARSAILRLLPLLLPAIVSIALAAEARAGFHHHRRGCGCGACHHRGWHRGCHGSSAGSFGGSFGGSSGGSCHGGSAGGAAAAAPKAAAAPAATPPAAPAKAAGIVPADGAVLIVEVPANARVFINGVATGLTGGVRHFFTAGLAADKRYSYEIRVASNAADAAGDAPAGADADRTAAAETKTVWLEAGQQQVVSFTAGAAGELSLPAPAVAAERPAATNLTLRVPADASVWIAGQPTTRTGAVRRFSTSALAAGQTWEDYEVRVVSVVDGREREVVRKLTLTGGAEMELALDPASAADVAATASLAP